MSMKLFTKVFVNGNEFTDAVKFSRVSPVACHTSRQQINPLLSWRLPHFSNPFVQEQQIIRLDMGENDSHFFISNIGHAAQSREARTSTHDFDPHSCPRWQRFRRSNPASKET